MKPYKAVGSLVLFVSAVWAGAFGQENVLLRPGGPDNDRDGGSLVPLVYSLQNTGAHYPAPAFPDLGHLPIVRPLPDPFQSLFGFRDTSFFNWERRRNEIMAAIEKYEIGPVPDGSDCTVTANYTPPATGSNVGSLTVVVTRKSNGKSLTLTSGVYVPPNAGAGPFPALIPMAIASLNFNGTNFNFPPPPPPDYGSLPASVFQGLPIATVDFVSTQVASLTFGEIDHSADPFYQLYPELVAGVSPGTSNSGVYAAWTWGVSRLIDGLTLATQQAVNPLPVDLKHLGVTGCSFAGKMALFAGAFDERIALTISQENGGGGAPSWRVSHEIEADGSVEDIHDTSYDWFGGQMRQFAEAAGYKLPEDHHELMALVAPRALLETGNTDFYWLSNRSNYISARATQAIYETFGIGDRFGFYIDGGHAHCGTLPAEAPAITAFVDRFLLGDQTVAVDVHVNPYPNLDYQRWTWWWGKGDPAFPNDWNPGDGTVVASTLQPLLIKSGDTVAAGYAVSLPGAHPAATALVAGADVETDVLALDGTSYTLTIPLPGQSYSIAANDSSWMPTNDPRNPSAFEGSATASAGGLALRTYFRAVGTTTGAGNPGGAGLSTDTVSSIDVKFHARSGNRDAGVNWSRSVPVSDGSP